MVVDDYGFMDVNHGASWWLCMMLLDDGDLNWRLMVVLNDCLWFHVLLNGGLKQRFVVVFRYNQTA